MWGNVVLETIFNGNYVFGFLTNRSNVLLHLTHWQYWFWFWFTWFLGLYYLIFLNFFFKRSLKIYPKINTSFRSHGKWGDFIVCVVPISWCLNILTNSNFILRLVEWQSESNSFTLRVRAKQWYWVYKIDIMNLLNSANLSKQIGNNNWVGFNKSNTTFLYEIVQLQNQFELQKTFWKEGYSAMCNIKELSSKSTNLVDSNTGLKTEYNYNLSVPNYKYPSVGNVLGFSFLKNQELSNINQHISYSFKKNSIHVYDNMEPFFKKKDNTLAYRLGPDFSLTENNTGFLKKNQYNSFAIIKQKRFAYKSSKEALSNLNQPELGLFFSKSSNDFAKNFIFNKRLLRTSKLLVLPTNVNISVITNSFDVIHSWFIPGIGFKLDCVPGRSTHHTMHLLNPGFYYGQCAEICGRYHHHMPIRICALSYNHFLFWWNNKGFNQFFKNNNSFYKI